MLSIIIPLKNEYDSLLKIESKFTKENVFDFKYEVILVNDFSTDDTFLKAKEISNRNKQFLIINNLKKGLGGAINIGIEKSKGNFICIMMADFSDSIEDLKKYYSIISEKKIDAVFGSRFMRGSKVINYPKQKYILNRMFNFFVGLVFFNRFNDYTNAFKIYKSNVLKSFLPLVSESFNIFLEIPLKILSRKKTYEIVPISWKGRNKGKAKFNIKELRSKYLFTLIYCLAEKILLKTIKK